MFLSASSRFYSFKILLLRDLSIFHNFIISCFSSFSSFQAFQVQAFQLQAFQVQAFQLQAFQAFELFSVQNIFARAYT